MPIVLRFLVKVVNCVLLVLILIGIPAVTRVQFGDWQMASASKARLLIFLALALAAAGNAIPALTVKKDQDRHFFWEWSALFGFLLTVEYAYISGYLSFDWLKNSLTWLQRHL